DPLPALRQPRDVFVGQRVVEEQGLVEQSERAGDVVTEDRVPVGRRAPLLAAGDEGGGSVVFGDRCRLGRSLVGRRFGVGRGGSVLRGRRCCPFRVGRL